MKTRVYQPTPRNYARIANLLRAGELVGVPSETVYGLAADATNQEACRKIFEAKQRPFTDPLIVHILDLNQARNLSVWNHSAGLLAKQFWPGPLTLVLERSRKIDDIITAGQDTVALRMPSHPVFQKILYSSALPLAAPSANVFGYISPTRSAHVKEGLDGKIPAIMEGGSSSIGLESTILSIRDECSPELLRPGAITVEEIERCIGQKIAVNTHSQTPDQTSPAPGMLLSHYSPKTPLFLHARMPQDTKLTDAIVYFRSGCIKTLKNHFTLSHDGSGETAARNLFSLLRDLDRGNWKRIHVELPPRNAKWSAALVDRLKRAAAKAT